MTQIHDDLRATGSTPARPAKRRNPFLRRAIVLPVSACALAGAVATGIHLVGGSDDVTAVPTGPS
jgi:hypothetical protein